MISVFSVKMRKEPSVPTKHFLEMFKFPPQFCLLYMLLGFPPVRRLQQPAFCLTVDKITKTSYEKNFMEFSWNVDNGPREIALNLSKGLGSRGTLSSDLGLYPTLYVNLYYYRQTY